MINWGIIGLGRMANRFASAINEAENANLLGIASKSIDRLKTFGEEYNIENNFRFNTYDEILNCGKINSIYISTLNNTHADIVIKAAQAKKNILCEKPNINVNLNDKILIGKNLKDMQSKNPRDYDDVNYSILNNKDYENNNILNSIFYGEKAINGNVIIAYSDILFESSVVRRLLDSDHDISVVVDIDWRGYYVGRKEHPLAEAENVIFNSNNEVIKIGKIATEKQEVHGEFIGMMKLTHGGAEIFKQNFHRVKKLYWSKPFQRAKTFQNAYLTDMIQELVDIGIKVHCVIIERGWKEIDTVEDYQKALQEFKQ